jgi:DNA-binding winged helix-turn-helix (wHTH) protein
MDERAISFGSFRLLPSQRLLLEGDEPVRLGSRALDILAVLAEKAGRVVLKEELIARVWPKVFVEESNLKIQVSALRRVLGDGQGGNRHIVTVPGRGYEFVAPVGLTAEPAAMPAPVVPQPGTHNLPLAMTRMIGREEAVATLVSRLSRERLLTIVGPGGVGKTTLALAVAERVIANYEHGVWLVDLAPLGDPRLVPSAVATVLGLEVRTDNSLPGLIAALRDRQMLLLLDNCEHVIDAAASLAAAVLTGVPRINILATSREPLGVAGERGTPPRTAWQPADLVRTDGSRGGGLSSRAAIRRACYRDCRRFYADRCECPTGRRYLPEARRPAVGDRVRRPSRRGAWGRRPCRRSGPQLAAAHGAAPYNDAAASDDAGRR